MGCKLLYLPAYSPDYNPIKEASAKIKSLLRKAAARSKEALIDALGVALSSVMKMLVGSLSTLATVQRVNYCEMCCESGSNGLQSASAPLILE